MKDEDDVRLNISLAYGRERVTHRLSPKVLCNIYIYIYIYMNMRESHAM